MYISFNLKPGHRGPTQLAQLKFLLTFLFEIIPKGDQIHMNFLALHSYARYSLLIWIVLGQVLGIYYCGTAQLSGGGGGGYCDYGVSVHSGSYYNKSQFTGNGNYDLNWIYFISSYTRYLLFSTFKWNYFD